MVQNELDLQIEQGEVTTEKAYVVTAKLRFTEKDLLDIRPLQITKRQLFDALSKNQSSEELEEFN